MGWGKNCYLSSIKRGTWQERKPIIISGRMKTYRGLRVAKIFLKKVLGDQTCNWIIPRIQESQLMPVSLQRQGSWLPRRRKTETSDIDMTSTPGLESLSQKAWLWCSAFAVDSRRLFIGRLPQRGMCGGLSLWKGK